MTARVTRPPMVLAYHVVAEVGAEHDPDLLAVPPERFRQQIQSLQRRGYTFVSVRELAQQLHGGGPLPGVCAVTFDDGSEDNATIVPAILEDLGGVPATMYVCPGLLGAPHPFLAEGSGHRIMSEGQLLELAQRPGIEIGSHTSRHTELAEASEEEALRELTTSKSELEQLLGLPVDSFAYPRCRYSPGAALAARKAGFTSAVTCGVRGAWTPYELRREYIVRSDTRLMFELKARGAFRLIRKSPPGRALAAATHRLRPS